jgi:zinc protease
MLFSSSALAAIDLRNASLQRLDNGLTVIVLEDRSFPVVSVQMLYRVGARDEVTGKTGLAHFVEHMAFRSSENFPGTALVSSIYETGGEWHGYTWIDQTTYFATVPAEHLELLLHIESDRLARLLISKNDMEAERGAVLAELHGYQNDPSTLLLDATLYTVFHAHPYRNNTIGWQSDIEQISHDDVLSFYRRHYNPANAVLVVVGGFDREKIHPQIKKLFGKIPGGVATPLPHTIEAPQSGERRVSLSGPVGDHSFNIAYRAPSASSPDYAPFLVLQELLGGGSGINFGQNDWGSPVRAESFLGTIQNDVAHGLTTWFPPSAQDYVFVIGGSAADGATRADIEQQLEQQIRLLRDQPVSSIGIEKALGRVMDELVYDVETTEDAAHQLAFFEGLGAYQTLLDLPGLLALVTPEAVQDVARRYLNPGQRTIAWWQPSAASSNAVTETAPELVTTPGPGSRSSEINVHAVPPPTVHRLSNGAVVLLQQSGFSSSAFIRLLLPSGLRDVEGARSSESVWAHDSLDKLVRPGNILSALQDAASAVRNAQPLTATTAELSRDPPARLEQEMARIMVGKDRVRSATFGPVVITIAGDIEKEAALSALERYFGHEPNVPAGQPGGEQLTHAMEGSRTIACCEHRVSLGRNIAQAQVGYVVAAPPPGDSGFWAFRILMYILNHGYEGRLGTEAISRQGLVYYIDSQYQSNGTDAWVTLASGVDPGKLEAFRSLLATELSRLVGEPVTLAEVEEAKTHLIGRARSAAQSNEELTAVMAQQWLWYGKLLSADELARILSGVSQADVARVVEKFVAGWTVIVAE